MAVDPHTIPFYFGGMKNKPNSKPNPYHVVVPFGPPWETSDDSLFDDCPVCQLLRESIQKGEATTMDEEEGEEPN
jgi:hypothetical protein